MDNDDVVMGAAADELEDIEDVIVHLAPALADEEDNFNAAGWFKIIIPNLNPMHLPIHL